MPEPYTLVGPVRRFNQKFTAFARSDWDPACAAYGVPHRGPEDGRADRPGYSAHDYALQAGARAVDRAWRRNRTQAAAEQSGGSATPSPPGDAEAADPPTLTQRVKQAAAFYGAALVGATRVNPLWVYACDGEERPVELPEGVETAVVMAIAMDYALIRTSPSVQAAAATGLGYSRMAFAVHSLARYLEELGWRAIPSRNDTALSIPLAIDAGLGELGRNGLLLTRPFGPRVRLCKVFTDAPLVPDHPMAFGAKHFCQVCARCAESCPAAAIPAGDPTASGPTPSNNPGILKWYVNADACLAFWRRNGACCSNCIRSCPFNKPRGWVHEAARLVVRARSRWLDRGLIRLDRLLGYGRQAPAR